MICRELSLCDLIVIYKNHEENRTTYTFLITRTQWLSQSNEKNTYKLLLVYPTKSNLSND